MPAGVLKLGITASSQFIFSKKRPDRIYVRVKAINYTCTSIVKYGNKNEDRPYFMKPDQYLQYS